MAAAAVAAGVSGGGSVTSRFLLSPSVGAVLAATVSDGAWRQDLMMVMLGDVGAGRATSCLAAADSEPHAGKRRRTSSRKKNNDSSDASKQAAVAMTHTREKGDMPRQSTHARRHCGCDEL